MYVLTICMLKFYNLSKLRINTKSLLQKCTSFKLPLGRLEGLDRTAETVSTDD